MLPERAQLSRRRRPSGAREAGRSAGWYLPRRAKVQGAELVGQRVTFYGYVAPRNPQARDRGKDDRLRAH